ncbi:NADH-quinone oxidoreductase subunit M [Buchnera aphidicola (Ceratoglyphina bambusae)]|uniref:complex I subunit 4 family protein n=1 Tax=Buchnera aphidicola TaxID=9 RepID=UPI0031B83428
MLLPFLIIIPFLGGIFSWILYLYSRTLAKFIAIFSIVLVFLLNTIIFKNHFYDVSNIYCDDLWYEKFFFPLMCKLDISINLALDRFSIYMIFLLTLLCFVSIIFSWNEKNSNSGAFYLNVLILFSSIIGVFLSKDLFLFFCFWEIMIFPICFLNIFYGLKTNYKNKIKCVKSFFLHSQISSLIMFSSILLLVHYNYSINGIWTFDFNLLKNSFLSSNFTEYFVLFGFLLSFLVKMPSVPFHTWLPSFSYYSPIGNSVDLLGFLSKVGVYSILRFFIPLSHNVFYRIQILGILLGVINIFYGIFMASIKNNLKYILSYINIAHSGIMLVSIFNINNISYEGLLLYIISSTICSTALFVLSSKLYKQIQTYNLNKVGGLWDKINIIPEFFLFFSLSNFGLPGTGNFISELLIFLGLFLFCPKISIICIISLMFFVFCSLKMFHRIFYGELKNKIKFHNINFLEIFTILLLTCLLILIGLFPNFILYKFDFYNDFLYKNVD